jgi:hypothetical protein
MAEVGSDAVLYYTYATNHPGNEMDTTDTLLILATVSGPILAVQAQKWVERITENRNRKLRIFYTLMATRATPIALEHVQALNAIDLEFHEEVGFWIFRWKSKPNKDVVDKWRIYMDWLNQPAAQTPEELTTWSSKLSDYFTELMYSLSQSLGYSFDKVYIRRSVYHPKGLGEVEFLQKSILQNLYKLLNGEIALPMKVTEFPGSDSKGESK